MVNLHYLVIESKLTLFTSISLKILYKNLSYYSALQNTSAEYFRLGVVFLNLKVAYYAFIIVNDW